MREPTVVTNYIILFHSKADRRNGILKSFLLLFAETKIRNKDIVLSILIVILKVPQGSVLEPTFFSLSINYLVYLIITASVYYCTNQSNLSDFETVSEFIIITERESLNTVDWFHANKIILNPDKFNALIIDKKRQDHTSRQISIDTQNLKTVS